MSPSCGGVKNSLKKSLRARDFDEFANSPAFTAATPPLWQYCTNARVVAV